MLSSYLAIGFGGAFGSMFRAFLARVLPETFFHIPMPILFVNILGCFIIGLLGELFANFSFSAHSQMLKLFLTTGFLGGFTTFSTFSLEAGTLFIKHQYMVAWAYIILSVGLSIAAFFCGLYLVKIFL